MTRDVARSLTSILPATGLGTWTPSPGEEVETLPLAAPSTLAEWSDVLRLALRESLRVQVAGQGSKRSWSTPDEETDLVLSTRAWRGVSSYEPGDGTLSARSGSTMSDLAATVAQGGHHLSPDVPRPERASLGGVLGAGQSGFDRLYFGPTRSNVLGMRVLYPDGTVVKSGGQLVKNVTGYDLHRLYCGSRGTLCVILEASLRLFPRCDEDAVVEFTCEDRHQALERARAVLAQALRPRAVCVNDVEAEEGRWRLSSVLSGDRDVVRVGRERLEALWPSADVSTGQDARERSAALRELELHDGRWAPLRFSTRPSRMPAALEHLESTAARGGHRVRTLCHPGVATACAWIEDGGGPSSSSAASAIRDGLASSSGELEWQAPGPATAPPAPASALMQRLKASLDPKGVFPPGPFDDRT